MAAEQNPAKERTRSPVASLAKGLLVLDALSSVPPIRSVPGIMERTGFDRASVYRIIRSFMDAGYVERSSRGEYGISMRGYLLGVHLTQAHNLVRVAQPELIALRNEINETVNLAVLSGSDVVYLARFAVGRILSLHIDIGTRLPVFCSSLGRAILAHLPEAESEAILRQSDRQAFTPNTITSTQDLMTVLTQVRRRGYAVTDQEFELGLCSMAHPIFARGGRPIAAVNVAVSAARMTATELVRQHREPLQRICQRISLGLGWEASVTNALPPSSRSEHPSKEEQYT